MKSSLRYWAAAIVALTVVGTAAANTDVKFKRYGVEKLNIKFKVSGMQSGEEELGFDCFGMRERKLTTVETMGVKSSQLVIINGDDMFSVDQTAKTGNRIDTPMIKEMIAQGHTDMSEVSVEMMGQMGGKILRQESFLGKECDVWELATMGATVWMWKGIALKTITKLGGVEIVIEAYEIDDNPTFRDADFLPGPEVVITDQGTMENLMKQQQKMMQGN